MSSNPNIPLAMAQPFDMTTEDKPYEILDSTSKSTASSPLHIGLDNIRMDDNIKDYVDPRFDAQRLIFDSQRKKASPVKNVYINNSIALNITSNNVINGYETQNMAKKQKTEPSHSDIQKQRTGGFDNQICLNCGEKNNRMLDSYCPNCHSCIIGTRKDLYADFRKGSQDLRGNNDWSNNVNLARSQQTENFRINQPKFNTASKYDPTTFYFLPENSREFIHPQVQANSHYSQPKPPIPGEYSNQGNRLNNVPLPNQNNFGHYNTNQNKNFEPSLKRPGPPPPSLLGNDTHQPPSIFGDRNINQNQARSVTIDFGPHQPIIRKENVNHYDEDKLSFQDALFDVQNPDDKSQKSMNRELSFSQKDELSFQEDAFSFRGDEDNMLGWHEIDLADFNEDSQKEKLVMPLSVQLEEKKKRDLNDKKVEIIELLSEHLSDTFSDNGRNDDFKPSGLHKLFAKEDTHKQFSFFTKEKKVEKPVQDLISSLCEASGKRTTPLQGEHSLVPVSNKPIIEQEQKTKVSSGVMKEYKIKKKPDLLVKAKKQQTIPFQAASESQPAILTTQVTKTKAPEINGENQMQEEISEILKEKKVNLLKKTPNKPKAPKKVKDPNQKNEKKVKEKTKQTFKISKTMPQASLLPLLLKKLDETEDVTVSKPLIQEAEAVTQVKISEENKSEEKKEHKKESLVKKAIKKTSVKPAHVLAGKDKDLKQKEGGQKKEKEREKEKKEKLKAREKEKERHKEKEKERQKRKEERERLRDLEKQISSEGSDSEESEYFMFGEEYDMILECYSQESEFVDVHEVKRRMKDFDYIRKEEEEIEQIDEILFPKKTIICIGDEYQTKLPDLNKDSSIKRGLCQVWDPERISTETFNKFIEGLLELTKMSYIREEKVAEILVDNNYDVDQALKFCSEHLDYIKSIVITQKKA